MKKRSAPRGNYEGKALKHTETDQKPKGGPLQIRGFFLRFVCKNTENLQKKCIFENPEKVQTPDSKRRHPGYGGLKV